MRSRTVSAADSEMTAESDFERVWPMHSCEPGNEILLMDKNMHERNNISNRLSAAGYKMTAVATPADVLAILNPATTRAIDIRLVLLTLSKPAVDTFRILDYLREIQSSYELTRRPRIHVCILCKPNAEALPQCLERGAMGYFAKPLDFDDIERRIRVLLDRFLLVERAKTDMTVVKHTDMPHIDVVRTPRERRRRSTAAPPRPTDGAGDEGEPEDQAAAGQEEASSLFFRKPRPVLTSPRTSSGVSKAKADQLLSQQRQRRLLLHRQQRAGKSGETGAGLRVDAELGLAAVCPRTAPAGDEVEAELARRRRAGPGPGPPARDADPANDPRIKARQRQRAGTVRGKLLADRPPVPRLAGLKGKMMQLARVTGGSQIKTAGGVADVVLAGIAKEKAVRAQAAIKETAEDLLQAQLVEVEPGKSQSSRAAHFLSRGFELRQQGKFRDAVKMYRHAILNEPRNYVAYLSRAVAYDKLGNFQQAVDDASTCVRLQPRNPTARFNRAVVHTHLGDDEAAIADLTKAIELDPDRPEFYDNRALICRRVGRYSQANDDYAKSAALKVAANPNASQARLIKDTAARRDLSAMQAKADGRLDLKQFLSMADISGGDIYAHLFEKPTQEQGVLLRAPERRTAADHAAIEAVCARFRLFRLAPPDALAELARATSYSCKDAGAYVYEHGDFADAAYVLMSGRVSVKLPLAHSSSFATVDTLHAGDHFGVMALLKHGRHVETMVVDEPSEVLCVPREAFDRLLRAHVLEDLKEAYRMLRRTRIFDSWSPEDLTLLASCSTTKYFSRGSVIVHQNENPDSVFVLKKGICRIYKHVDLHAEMVRRKRQLQAEMRKLNTNYVYHHSLRHKKRGQKGPTADIWAEERRRQQLAELERVEQQLDGRLKPLTDKSNVQEVKALFPPALFGETVLVEPTNGQALGSVVADTYVEVMVISKKQLQTFDITDEMNEQVHRRAIRYPEDTQVIQSKRQRERWMQYRRGLIGGLSKTRWPQTAVMALSRDELPHMSGSPDRPKAGKLGGSASAPSMGASFRL